MILILSINQILREIKMNNRAKINSVVVFNAIGCEDKLAPLDPDFVGNLGVIIDVRSTKKAYNLNKKAKHYCIRFGVYDYLWFWREEFDIIDFLG